MSIIRVDHSKENPYVQIRRETLRDARLGMECMGLLVYLLSMSETWQISTKAVANFWGISVDTVQKRLNRLIELGYCKREQPRSKGQFGEMDYVIYEEPQENSNISSATEITGPGIFPPKERTNTSYKKEQLTPTPKKVQVDKPAKHVVVFSIPEWDSIEQVCKTKKEKLLINIPRSQDEIENAAKAFKQQAAKGEVVNAYGLLMSLLKDKAKPNVSKQQAVVQEQMDRLKLAAARREECQKIAKEIDLPKGATFRVDTYMVWYRTPNDPNERHTGMADADFWLKIDNFLKKIGVAPKPRSVD